MTIAITNDIDALATALRLAITAPNEKMLGLALDLARDLAATMNQSQVKKAKRAALNQIKNQQN
jgi:hypothetical protein